MAQAPADRLTPALIGLTGYYAVAALASLTDAAFATWVMVLIYCVPLVVAAVACVWAGAHRVLTRRRGARRPLPA